MAQALYPKVKTIETALRYPYPRMIWVAPYEAVGDASGGVITFLWQFDKVANEGDWVSFHRCEFYSNDVVTSLYAAVRRKNRSWEDAKSEGDNHMILAVLRGMNDTQQQSLDHSLFRPLVVGKVVSGQSGDAMSLALNCNVNAKYYYMRAWGYIFDFYPLYLPLL